MSQATHRLEALEQRRLLSAAIQDGVLVLTGTEGDDEIIVEADAGRIYVDDNGTHHTFDRALVSTIQMFGLGGDDLLGVWVDDTFAIPVYADGGAGNDFIDGASGNDTLIGGDGNDHLFGYGGNDIIYGGAGNDLISGGAGNDTLYGDAGMDMIYAGDGHDLLFGGDDDDELYGEAGSDDLDGGLGADLLDGGDDADRFMVPDDTDTMVNDGLDSIWLPPPPPEEPVSDKHPNWKRGHCNKPDHALGASTLAQTSHGEIKKTEAPGRNKR